MDSFFKLIQEGKLALVEQSLIDNPELTNVRDKHGNTPLHKAVSYGHNDIVALLLARGADIHARNQEGKTSMFMAKRWPSIVRLLVQAGADVNAQDNIGRTPLHESAFHGQPAEMQVLIDSGASIYVQSQEGSTVLHEAAVSGVKSAVRLLLSYGAEINSKDKFGSTPLHEAVGANMMSHEVGLYVEVIEELIKAGADLMAQDDEGQTPLDLARKQPYPELADLLRFSRKRAS